MEYGGNIEHNGGITGNYGGNNDENGGNNA